MESEGEGLLVKKYRGMDSIVEAEATPEEMGFGNTFQKLLLEAIEQAKKVPVGHGVRLSGIVNRGTLTGTWSLLKTAGKVNGECAYVFHRGRIYIRRTH